MTCESWLCWLLASDVSAVSVETPCVDANLGVACALRAHRTQCFAGEVLTLTLRQCAEDPEQRCRTEGVA